MIDFRSKKTVLLLSFIATFAIYGTSLHFPKFIFDDDLNIYQNWQVQHFSMSNILHFLKTSLTPIPYIVWQFISNTTGHFTTWNYRLVNILFHSLNASLLFFITMRIHRYLKLKGSELSFSLIATFIFLFHPTQTESVVWLSSLRILLATFFALISCSLISIQIFSQEGNNKSNSYYTPLAIVFFGLALLSKPTVLPIIAVLSFLPILKEDLSQNINSHKTLFRQMKNLLLPTISVLFIGGLVFFLHKGEVLSTAIENQSFYEKISLILMSISTVFMNLFLPFRLVFDYQVNPFVLDYLIESQKFTILSLFANLALIITLSLLAIKRIRIFGIALLLIFIFISPHIGLIFQDFQNVSTVADRYLYIALIPFSWLISGLFSCIQESRLKRPLLGICTILLLILCLKQISLWRQPEIILSKSNIHDSIQPPLLVAIGQNYESRGFPKIAKQFYKNALTKDPQIKGALSSLISLVTETPSKEDSLFIINFIKEHQTKVAPDDSTLYVNLLIENQEYEDAKKYLKANQGLGIDPIKTQNLLFKLENRTEELLIRSYEVLYYYNQGINQPKEALKYLRKLIKVPSAPKNLVRRYRELLNVKSGKK